MIVLNKDNIFDFSKGFWFVTEPDDVEMHNLETGEVLPVKFETAKQMFMAKGHNGVDFSRLMEIAKRVDELGIRLNEFNTKMIFKAEHSKTKSSDDLMTNYKKIGNTKCMLYGSDWTKEALEKLFREERRFRGRVPGIIDSMASASDTYRIRPEDVVKKFDIDIVKSLKGVGIPEVEIVLLYTQIKKHNLERMMDKPALLEQVANLLSKGILKDEDKFVNAAKWVSNHPNTDEELVSDVLNNPKMFKISEDSSVEKVRVQSGGINALSEIKKIEKAYKKPKFKFKECTCELMMSEAENDRYKAYILQADDPRQVMLGHETHCCQILGDAGETAMLHGLLNPKAGFWGVFDVETDKLRCQAECWEYNEETLVFDNIEFADDTELDRYKDIIGEWLVSSPYKNICMGLGWNSMQDSSFKQAPDFTPPVTPREIYVMSYEEDAELPYFYDRTAPNKSELDNENSLMRLRSEEVAKEMLDSGRINYYDYLYADVDDRKGIVYLKEDFKVADYFEVPKEKQDEYKEKFSNKELKEKADRIEKYESVIGNFLSKKNERDL